MAVSDRFQGRRLSRRLAALLAIPLSGLTVACGEPTGPIADEVYVEAMTRLSYAHTKFPDRPRRDSARIAVFDDLRITPDDLVAFVERWGDDPQRMFRLSELIRVRVDSLAALDQAELAAPSTNDPEPPP
ncbi:MAG: hypothetical protein R3195_15670 [Gemmatimonadota bacterium]|nr:hypothetical protein [Gemmatimonadota bacterium]